MSLAGFSASDSTIWIVNTAGIIGYNNVNYTLRLRPVIILNADTLVTGDGTSSDPFVVSQTKNEKNMQKTLSSFARRKTAKKLILVTILI